ncbi:MAG: sialidase family protein [Gemmatimonadota bacterium]
MSMQAMETPAGAGSGEPFLSTDGSRLYMSWLEEAPAGAHDLRVASLGEGEWDEPRTVERSEAFFVNWADFPSVTPTSDGLLWAHWLERGATGGYDYGVRVVRSSDDGRTWSDPWTPHEDGTPTEHGFVAVLPMDDGIGLTWLDGRRYVDAPDGTPATREMTLRFRMLGAGGMPGPETLVDPRVCDCCQTDAAMSDAGPVVVYRDRTEAEIRDIYVTRRLEGEWTEGVPVHDDGWEIGGCPVNGPAVAARGRQVAVAWFTAPGDVPRVKVAFSSDAGASFGAPVVVDDGNPIGRVDVLYTGEGRALVSWLEQTGDESAELRVREVRADGAASASGTVAASSAARASGFPRMARTAEGGVVLAWTDVSGERSLIRMSRLELEEE